MFYLRCPSTDEDSVAPGGKIKELFPLDKVTELKREMGQSHSGFGPRAVIDLPDLAHSIAISEPDLCKIAIIMDDTMTISSIGGREVMSMSAPWHIIPKRDLDMSCRS